MPLVGGAQNCATDLHDACGVLPGQRHDIASFSKHPLESVAKSHDLPSKLFGRAENAAEHCIEPGTVAAACQDAYTFFCHR